MNKLFKQTKVWVPLALAVAFAGGIWVGNSIIHTNNTASGALGKMEILMDMISTAYVDDLDTDSLLEATIPDLMAKLDPHSVYIPASDLSEVNSELEGSFSGIGVSFNRLIDTITVLEVIPGGPSERVGLMPGDRIVTIDDSVAVGAEWTDQKVISRLRGPENSVVKLGIKRNTSKDLLPYEVTRGNVPVTSVDAAYIISPGIGYIKVNKFGRNTFDEFLQSAGLLKHQSAEKFIIDLRGNGGGFMEMAVLMANEFLPEGSVIVSTKGRNPMADDFIASDGNGSFKDAEVVVLLDEYSASASEIFAGAIQDNDRGVVIGRRSFGKGLVQQQFPLPDSSAVRLTVQRYYTPSGRSIQKMFKRGKADEYGSDLLQRFNHGEAYSADSIRLDSTAMYLTRNGRTVFGGGGIMPDIFVPSDTSGFTTYYIDVMNAGLPQKFAFDMFEKNRQQYSEAKDLDELMEMLPADRVLLRDFANYAASKGVPMPYWYIINQSRMWIVKSIKSAIARDALGLQASYQLFNENDKTIEKAVEILTQGTDSILSSPK